MKLLEFITYCQLKGFIVNHTEVDAKWDTNADSHWKIVLNDGEHKARIAYAICQDVGVTMSTSLQHNGMFSGNINLSEIVEAFIPNELT